MKILHLAAGNRWTGAAAPAFAEVAALREAGIDAHFGYVGGYKLQAKIGRLDFAHPIIQKAQNPFSFLRSSQAIEHLLHRHGFDVVHTHLTYDHWLARFAIRWPAQLVRTFHSRRVIRSDPFTRNLIARSDLICVTNDTLRDAPPIRDRSPLFTPPPLDQHQFRPYGPDVRNAYGIGRDVVVVAAIGKLSPDRGFELVLQTFATVRKRLAKARLLIIGHGEYRPSLEALARELTIADDVIWAGYHEDDLAEHYRAADFLLFASKGSDEGHRAVIEAMACATVPIAAPLPGMQALLGDLSASLIAHEDLAACVMTAMDRLDDLRARVIARSNEFIYPRAAERLLAAYSKIL